MYSKFQFGWVYFEQDSKELFQLFIWFLGTILEYFSSFFLKSKSGDPNIPELAGYTEKQLGIYPSVLLGWTLTNSLSVSIYMYTKDWRGSYLSNQSAARITDFQKEIRHSTSLSALSGGSKVFQFNLELSARSPLQHVNWLFPRTLV